MLRQTLTESPGIGWRVLQRDGWSDTVFAFRDTDEIGPKMLAKIAKQTGLTPDDL
jgi:hypothetical protein